MVGARGGLKLQGLVKRFGALAAVDGVDLELPAGQLISFLGPSGCGKTTLLRMIAGLEQPTQGRILVDDEDVTDQPPHVRDMGMVFQSLALFPHLTVAGNIGYAMRIRGVAKDRIRERVDELVGSRAAEPFAPAGRPFRQWAAVPPQRTASWAALLDEARLFASAPIKRDPKT